MVRTRLIRHKRSGCAVFCPTLLLLVLLLAVPPPAQAAPAGSTSGPGNPATAARYTAAHIYYTDLLQDPALKGERSNWLTGVRKFRRLYFAAPEGERAPGCLYTIADMYRRMYKQFGVTIDLDESISTFSEFASTFPDSEPADDALFSVAEMELEDKGNPVRAAAIFQKILEQYPEGNAKDPAVQRLQEIAAAHGIPLPEQLVEPAAPAPPAELLPVQYWSSDQYTRVVIRTSAPVEYSARLLEKNNNLPRRLYLDFQESYIPLENRILLPIQDGLLKQVRPEQVDETSARIILDIGSISYYRIFSLKDPFRVIIDVRGAKREELADTPVQEKEDRPIEEPSASEDPHQPPPAKSRPPLIGPEVLLSGDQDEIIILEDDSKVKPELEEPQADIFLTLEDSKKVRVAAEAVFPETETSPEGSSLSLAQQLGLGVRRIVIDPGHGGKDPGAMAFDLKEKDIVLIVARKTAAILEQNSYEVLLTRDSDSYLSLEERTAIANTKSADLFVSIHVNAHPRASVQGVETFYLNLATNSEAMRVAARENATSTRNISELQDILSELMQNAKILESSQLAEVVQSSLISGLEEQRYGTKNLGVKQAPFYVLIGAEMPAILAEISFLTNPEEAQRLKDDAYLQAIAEQIAGGVTTYIDRRRTAALQL